MPIIKVNPDVDTLILSQNPARGRYDTNIYEFPKEALNQHVKTPTHMIKLDGLVNSTINNFTDYCTLHYIDYSLALETNPDTSSGFKGSGANKISDIVIIIANDSYISPLITKLFLRQVINQVTVVHLHWTGGDQAPAVLNQLNLGNVYLTEYHPGTFSSLFVLRTEEYLHKWSSFKQEDATNRGVTQTSFNFRENKTDVTIQPANEPSIGGGGGGEQG